jgi:hypothetical protein
VAAFTRASAADVTVTATGVDVTGSGTRAAVLLARYSGDPMGSYYQGALVNNGGSFAAQIIRVVNGVAAVVANTPLTGPAMPTGPVDVRFNVRGEELELFVSGVVKARVTDTSLLEPGLVGMEVTTIQPASFDSFNAVED